MSNVCVAGGLGIPALLMRISTRPNVSIAASTTADRFCSLPRSAVATAARSSLSLARGFPQARSCPLRSGTPDGQLSTRPTSSRDQDPARHLLPEPHARLSGSAPRVALQQSSRAVTEERSDNPGSSPPSEIGACSICRMPREPLTNHRFVYCCQDGGKSLLDLATQLWMSEYVEFVLADRGEGTRSHLRRVEPGL